MFFERLEPGRMNWNELSSLRDATIFQSRAWLDFVAKTQWAEPVIASLQDGSTRLGYFFGLIIRKFGSRILGSPFPGWTSSYMGLAMLNDVPRSAAIEPLVRFAFHDLQCVHLEMMDRHLTLDDLQGLLFRHRVYSGFEIDLTKSEQELFGNMSAACRRCIRKASKVGVTVEEASDVAFAEDFYVQLTDVFAKQNLVPNYSLERVRRLIEHVYPTGLLLLLRARDPQGRCIGTGIFPAMNDRMYFWGGASFRDGQSLRPNEAIQWYAMRHWRDRGVKFYDMGGGGKYKEKYGGYEITVPWIRISKNAIIAELRDIAKLLVDAQQKVLGWNTAMVRQIKGRRVHA